MANYKRNKIIYTIFLLICIVGFWFFENFYTPTTYSKTSKEVSENSFPKKFLPSSTTGEIVHHSYFTLSYNEPFEQAEWVAYDLRKEHLTYDKRKRPYFIEDPWVRTKSADWKNYKGSGYDRGHLCPAGDRRFSKQAYNETFYTSNISPQNREFNAGVWNRLETQIRSWAKKYNTLYVFTGGVLERGLREIGQEDVDVPNLFYKIVVKENNGSIDVLGFLMPNEEQSRPLKDFTVTIDEIEELTNIDFFQGLDETVQTLIESKVEIGDWKF